MSVFRPQRGQERKATRIDTALRLVSFGVCALFVVVLARVAQLELRPGSELAAHVQLRQSGRSVDATRGQILDRRGRVLATSRVVYRVVIDPTLLPEQPGSAVVELAEVLGLDADELGMRLMGSVMKNETRQAQRTAMGLDQKQQREKRSVGELLKRKIGIESDSIKSSAVGQSQESEPGHPRPVFLSSTAADPKKTARGRPGSLVQGDTDTTALRAPKLSRYLPVSGQIEQELADRVRALRLAGVHLERREFREYTGGDLVASIVGKTGVDDLSLAGDGWLGLERSFDTRLNGEDGSLRYVRDAWGRPLWVQDGAWRLAEPGHDLRLSLDLELQRIAVDELLRGVEEADAAGGRLVMADPTTGEILAMVDLLRPVPQAVEFPWVVKSEATGVWTRPHGDLPADLRDRPRYITQSSDPGRLVHPALGRNRCVEDVYEPGSTFKPFVWTRANELGLLPDDEVLEQRSNAYRTPYGRVLRDVTFRSEMSWREVLVFSSNIGMTKLSERLSHEQEQGVVERLGFGQRTGLGLAGESPGIVTSLKNWSVYSQTSVAMGHEVAVTPVQMVRAFSSFARPNNLSGTVPRLRLTAAGLGRRGMTGEPLSATRVYDPAIIAQTRDALVGVVERLDKKNKWRFPDEPAPAYAMFGKSGTAEIPCSAPKGAKRPRGSDGYFEGQYNSSFIAAAPAEAPRLVVIVVIDDPGPSLVRRREHYGSWVAGPVVRRVVERSLRYMGVEPSGAGEEEIEPEALARAETD